MIRSWQELSNWVSWIRWIDLTVLHFNRIDHVLVKDQERLHVRGRRKLDIFEAAVDQPQHCLGWLIKHSLPDAIAGSLGMPSINQFSLQRRFK